LTVYDGDSVIIGGLIEDRDRIAYPESSAWWERCRCWAVFFHLTTLKSPGNRYPADHHPGDHPQSGHSAGAEASAFWSGTLDRVSMKPPAAESVKAELMFNKMPDEDFIKQAADDVFLPGDDYFSIQAYSFPDEAEAEQKAGQLAKMNYRTWIRPVQIKGKGTWYRVFVGQYRGQSQAEEALRQMLNQDIFPKDMYIVDRAYVYGTP
jgi:hypothetical protein